MSAPFFKAIVTVCFLAGGLSGCSTPGPGEAPDGIWDPYEASNRKVHAFNKSLDTNIVRPVSRAYVTAVPESLRYSVTSFADTAGTPNSVLNQILQADLGGAARNTLRFAINATLGFGGLADVATALGLPRDESGFGETLHVWGLPEGAYVESPFSGPSTERDRAGRLVDLVLDPFGHLAPEGLRHAATGTKIADRLGDRGTFAETVDSILYDSADSYAQSRLLYLQNRRFDLGDTAQDTYIDPYALDTEGF